MEHALLSLHGGAHAVGVPDIAHEDLDLTADLGREGIDPSTGIKRIIIAEGFHFFAFFHQFFREVAADKAVCTGHHNSMRHMENSFSAGLRRKFRSGARRPFFAYGYSISRYPCIKAAAPGRGPRSFQPRGGAAAGRTALPSRQKAARIAQPMRCRVPENRCFFCTPIPVKYNIKRAK